MDEALWFFLAKKFAERDLTEILRALGDGEDPLGTKHKIIHERMKPYLAEFKENTIHNLRFKLFKAPRFEEEE